MKGDFLKMTRRDDDPISLWLGMNQDENLRSA
jgi:hypothetical protein